MNFKRIFSELESLGEKMRLKFNNTIIFTKNTQNNSFNLIIPSEVKRFTP